MAKQKKKIKNSVSKRFKITASGKVVYRHQMMSHLRRKKSAKRKRRLKTPAVLEGAFAKKIKQMLGEA